MYKLTNSEAIFRIGDSAYIQPTSESVDYAAYLAWLALGNTPLSAFNPAEIAANTIAENNAKHIAYLASTDWYIWRKADNGTPVPAEITAAREAARKGVI